MAVTNPQLQQVLGGRFRLDRPLGQGGMGTVYVATDLSINRQVAIKVLRRELADDVDSLERMREEAVSLAALRHPNVVQLYDFHSASPETTFLLMELVDGESLTRVLARHDQLPVAQAVDYVRQVLSALAAAHARGIIHRDIKPGNVLVVHVPMQRDLIKVLDFGIAKLTEETIRRRPTTAGVLLGTPSWMSPEQASGRLVDARSDIYSAALLLYTLLAGENPFSGGDVASTLVRIQGVMPDSITNVRPDVPPALAEVIAIAMAKEPGQRFQSAAEFVQALDWAMGASEPARPSHASGQPPAVRTSAPPPSPHPIQSAPPDAPTWGPTGPSAFPTGMHPASVHTASMSPPPPRTGGVSTGAVVAIVVLACLLVTSVGALALFASGKLGTSASEAPPAPNSAAPPIASDAPPSSTATVVPNTAASVSVPPPSASAVGKSGNKPASSSNVALAANTAGGGDIVPGSRPKKCRCHPTPDNWTELKMTTAQPMGQKFVPLTCECNSLGKGTVCTTQIPACEGDQCNKQPSFSDSCKGSRYFHGRLKDSCTGWNSVGQKVTGYLDSCAFPPEVTGVSLPAGSKCVGFALDGRRAEGLVQCDP